MSGGVSGGGLLGGTSAPSGAGGTTAGDAGGGVTGGALGGGTSWLGPNGGTSVLGTLGSGSCLTKPDADLYYVELAGDVMSGILGTPFGPLRTSPASTNQLTWAPDGLYVPPPPERTTLVYRYSANPTMADPGAGLLRANTTLGGATALALDVLSDGGADVSDVLRVLTTGDGVYVQDKDNAANWARYGLAAPSIDHTGWFELPVSFSSGGGVTPNNNAAVTVTFTLVSPPSPAGPVAGHDHLTTASGGVVDYARLLVSATAPAAPVAPSDAFWLNPNEVA